MGFRAGLDLSEKTKIYFSFRESNSEFKKPSLITNTNNEIIAALIMRGDGVNSLAVYIRRSLTDLAFPLIILA